MPGVVPDCGIPQRDSHLLRIGYHTVSRPNRTVLGGRRMLGSSNTGAKLLLHARIPPRDWERFA